ncbi:MAG: hypothetical protein AB2A00_28205 [Myxococcota bacterium]
MTAFSTRIKLRDDLLPVPPRRVTLLGMHRGLCVLVALLGLFCASPLRAQGASDQPADGDEQQQRGATTEQPTRTGGIRQWAQQAALAGQGVPGLVAPDAERPLTLFQGIPSYVRYQTWWFILYVQDIPVLDPVYWDRAIGDPWMLNPGTKEKLESTPSVARLYFYGYYMAALQRFHFTPNPERVYGTAFTSSNTPVSLALGGGSEGFFTGLAQTLGNRFSAEEGADLLFSMLTRVPGLTQSRESWQGWKMLAIHSGFWLAGAWLAYQLARDQGLIRAGHWFRFRGSEFGVGTFASLGDLGVSLKPSLSADVRFVVPGVEAAFGMTGRADPDPTRENLVFESGFRTNWLRSFSRWLRWDVFAFVGARYAALVTSPVGENRVRFLGSLNARRENFFREGLTVSVDSGVNTDVSTQAGWYVSLAAENVRDGLVAGMRFSVLQFHDRPEEDVGATIFLALPTEPEWLGLRRRS